MTSPSEPADASTLPPRHPPRAGVVRLPLSAADLRAYDTIIDARTPSEWGLDHLPGALSCPVLSDAERVEVGTLYKQVSSFEAKRKGAAYVSRNVAAMLQGVFADKPKSWRPLVYCWRGGTRSGALTHVLRQVGWDAVQLEGGYKQWRVQVVHDLARMPAALKFIAIAGRTGSGKTRLLDALAVGGEQVLDLEGLAAHRGSVLGNLPDQPQPSQKYFESTIWRRLAEFTPDRPVYVEAESKKIGMLRVPDALIKSMWASRCVELVTPFPVRVALLRAEYAHLIANPTLLTFKLGCLAPLHSHKTIEDWIERTTRGDWDGLVGELLSTHYDPAYSRSMGRNYASLASPSRIAIEGMDDAAFTAAATEIVRSQGS